MSTESAQVLPFPTQRKRSYPRFYVPKSELPPNVQRLPVGAFKEPDPLSYVGLQWLLRAHLANMTWREHSRLHKQLWGWRNMLPADHENQEGLANAQHFLMRLPCREERRRRRKPVLEHGPADNVS
jgi:hypothetical protein